MKLTKYSKEIKRKDSHVDDENDYIAYTLIENESDIMVVDDAGEDEEI